MLAWLRLIFEVRIGDELDALQLQLIDQRIRCLAMTIEEVESRFAIDPVLTDVLTEQVMQRCLDVLDVDFLRRSLCTRHFRFDSNSIHRA